jgi:hypothetical protein
VEAALAGFVGRERLQRQRMDLAAHALDSTVASGRAVVALCPYIKAYVRHHQEAYAASLRPPTRADVQAAERAGAE